MRMSVVSAVLFVFLIDSTAARSTIVNNGTCGANEVLKECGTACEATCKPPTSCREQCLYNVCQCVEGFVRGPKGCIKETECPADMDMTTCDSVDCEMDGSSEMCEETTGVPKCFSKDAICMRNCPTGSSCRIYRGNSVCVGDDLYENPCANSPCKEGFQCKTDKTDCTFHPCQPIGKCVAVGKVEKSANTVNFVPVLISSFALLMAPMF